jgi:hypothetical protein
MAEDEAPDAARVAHAISQCMNLLFLFSAPLVFESVRKSGLGGLDDEIVRASLGRFLKNSADIRARAKSITGDVERLMKVSAFVEEIAGSLQTASLENGLPQLVVDRSRRALLVLGFAAPAGGWETFEGFTIPSLPPPK